RRGVLLPPLGQELRSFCGGIVTNISREDWLQALNEAFVPIEDDRDAVTIREFAEMFDMAAWPAGRHLRNLCSKGLAIKTTKRGVDGRGRRVWFTAYRLKK